MLQVPCGRCELWFFPSLQPVVQLEFVEMMFELFLEGVVMEQRCGKLLCNVLDWFPAGQAEVGAKCETTL